METRNPKRLRAIEKEAIQPVYLFFPVAPYPVNRREFHLLQTRIYSRCKVPHRITSVHMVLLRLGGARGNILPLPIQLIDLNPIDK